MGLERPVLLIALFLAAGLVFFLKRKTHVGFPSLNYLPTGIAAKAVKFLTGVMLPALVILSLIFLSCGLHFSSKEVTRYGYGSDIVVVIDESDSMNEPFSREQLTPSGPGNRPLGKIDASKKIIRPFIDSRKDRLGLVVFGGVTVPIYPLSFNHEGFLNCFDAQVAPLLSTVIDLGLAQALNMLENSPARTKVIVLISDGGGAVSDEKYQLSARINGHSIHFYWVAVDSHVGFYSNTTLSNPMDEFMTKLNPALAKTVSVTDSKDLENAFREIDRMERSLISFKERTEQTNSFVIFIWIGLIVTALFFSFEAVHND